MSSAEPLPPKPPQQAGAKPAGGAGSSEALSPRELDAIRQLRVLEERSVNLRKKAQLVDDTLLGAESRLREEVQLVNTELSEVRRRLADVEEGLRVVEDEMLHAANISDVRALEKYLSYWEPFQFVTQEELARRANLLKEQGSKPEEHTARLHANTAVRKH